MLFLFLLGELGLFLLLGASAKGDAGNVKIAASRPNFHLPARCTEGDINALFNFNGAWHLMVSSYRCHVMDGCIPAATRNSPKPRSNNGRLGLKPQSGTQSAKTS